MELRQLRHFIAVVDAKNFSGAASKVFLSQSALSRSIKNLEVEVGLPLLERKTQGVMPTQSGRRFYAEAKLILNDVQNALKSTISTAHGISGQFELGVGPIFMSHIAARAAAQIRKELPGINLVVVETSEREAIEALVDGRLDVVLNIFARPLLPELIANEQLFNLTAIVAAASNNSICRKRKLKASDFADVQWALIGHPRQPDVVEQFMLNNNLPTPHNIVRSNSITFIKSMILEQGFLSMLPDHVLARELSRGEVKSLPMPTGGFRRPAGLLYRKRDAHRQELSAVLNILRTACRDFAKEKFL